MRLSDFPSGWTKVCGPVALFGYATFRIRCGDEILVLDDEVLDSKILFVANRAELDPAEWRDIISDVKLPVWEKVFDDNKEIDSIQCVRLVSSFGDEYCAVVSCPYTSRADDCRSEPRILLHSFWKKC